MSSFEMIESQLKKVLINHTTVGLAADDIHSEVALVDGGLNLDSVALLELVVGIETEFDINLDDDFLTVENFSSLRCLAKCIQNELAKPTA